LDITVITDPLPTDTLVRGGVSADEGEFEMLPGFHDQASATKRTFHAWADLADVSASTLVGKRFRIAVQLLSDAPETTPVLRSVSARAPGASHTVEGILLIDAGDVGGQDSAALIDALNGLAESGSVVDFVDPWQKPDSAVPDEFQVTVEEVTTPERY